MKYDCHTVSNLNQQIIKVTTYVLIPQASKNVLVMARVTHKSTFEKRHIKYGGIEIDKLEEEHFERQIVIEFGLGAMHF